MVVILNFDIETDTIKKRDDEEKAYIAKMKPIWMEQKRQHLNKLNRREYFMSIFFISF